MTCTPWGRALSISPPVTKKSGKCMKPKRGATTTLAHIGPSRGWSRAVTNASQAPSSQTEIRIAISTTLTRYAVGICAALCAMGVKVLVPWIASPMQSKHVPLRSGFELVVEAPQPARSILAVGDAGDHEGDAGQAEDRHEQDSDLARDVHADHPEALRAQQRGQEQNPADRVKDQEEGGERVLVDGALEPGRRRGLGDRSHWLPPPKVGAASIGSTRRYRK